ncbi:Hypothetical protein A7982_03812 [Minicystis rosea]|nr:Hypothetical protein A7982_03812 [Minicystis rosea]
MSIDPAQLQDRFYFEACFHRDTSDDYIEGYFADAMDSDDHPHPSSWADDAKARRDTYYWGLPSYPIESFHANIAPEDLSTIQRQANDWKQWILARAHLRDGERIDHDASTVVVCKLEWQGCPEFAVAVFRKTNQSGIWYVIPSLRYDFAYNTLSFVQTPTGSTVDSPDSYYSKPSFSDLDTAKDKRTRRGVWSRIISTALAIGQTATFGFTNGAFKGAGVQLVRGIYDASTAPKASAMSTALSDLESFITEQNEKLVINDVTSVIRARNGKISDFMKSLEEMIADPTLTDMTSLVAPLTQWKDTFAEYTTGDAADQLPQLLEDLEVNQFAGESFPVFLAGVNVHNLCWQYLHALEIALETDAITRKDHIASYLNEMAHEWIKPAVRFIYEAIDDRLRNRLKHLDDDRTIQDSYLDLNVSISKKKQPHADVNRYLNNCYGAWIGENPDIPKQIAQLEIAAHAVGVFLAMPLSAAEKADFQLITYNNVAQTDEQLNSPTWRDGRSIQYGVQLVYEDQINGGATHESEIFWSRVATIDHWVWPRLIHLAACPYYSASTRRLVRRMGDTVDGSVVWEPYKILKIYDDGVSPRISADWDEAD